MVVMFLAGCLGSQTPEPPPSQTVGPGPIDSPVDLFPTGHRGRVGGEPTIAVLTDGTIFTNAWDETLRSTDGGRTWETVLDISLSDAQGGLTFSGDPWVWADPVTDRVFTMHGLVPCTAFWWSDDRGDSWTENRVGCITTYNDHPQLTSGPPGPEPNPLVAVRFPSVLYQCFNEPVFYIADLNGPPFGESTVDEQTVACLMSYDGGQTWPVERVLATHYMGTRGCGFLHSPAAIAADGIVAVAVAAPACEGIDIQISRDSGLTWQLVAGPRSTDSFFGANPAEPYLAWSETGALYALWRGSDNLKHGARMDTPGVWSDAWTISAPGVLSTEHGVLLAGSAGRLAIAYLGTRDSAEIPNEVPATTRWHLFLATSENADSDVPEFVHYQATSDQDPVQIGCTRPPSPARDGVEWACMNLRDFIGGASAPDGTFLVSFTDGCPPGCGSAEASRDTQTVVAALTGWNLKTDGPALP